MFDHLFRDFVQSDQSHIPCLTFRTCLHCESSKNSRTTGFIPCVCCFELCFFVVPTDLLPPRSVKADPKKVVTNSVVDRVDIYAATFVHFEYFGPPRVCYPWSPLLINSSPFHCHSPPIPYSRHAQRS